MRNQFTFYRSFWECAEKLQTKKEKLEFFEMLCTYALDETEPDLTTKKPAPATVFCAIRPTLERAHRKSKATRTENNLWQLDIVKDIVKVKDIDINIDIEKDIGTREPLPCPHILKSFPQEIP